MAKGNFECKRCGRKFSMAAHLARHMSSHGVKRKKKKTASGKRRGRPPGSKNKKTRAIVRRGRAAASAFDLQGMHLEDLTNLIHAARDEAERKLREAQAALR